MDRLRKQSVLYSALTLLAVLTGCALPSRRTEPGSIAAVSSPAHPLPAVAESTAGAGASEKTVQVAYQAAGEIALRDVKAVDTSARATGSSPDVPEQQGFQSSTRPVDPQDPFVGQVNLSIEQLVAEVQARNPSLQAAVAAWSAAAQRYPQQVSLEDPMFEYMVSPGVGRTGDGEGWMVTFSQKFPWPGKRDLRGNAATAEANAMQGDLGDTRLRLAEMTRMAYYDFYLAERMTEVNTATQNLLTQFRKIARNKYTANQATEQDVLQTDVEVANLQTRAMELSRDAQVAKARINTLLHRMPDSPLPPPAARLSAQETLPDAAILQGLAERSRPDLYAASSRARAEEANLSLSCKEYYPDVAVVAKYDGFMPDYMRPQVGMQMSVPLQNSRRSAAVREAEARVQQRRWEYQNLLDSVRFEVQSAHDRAAQAREVVRLYEERILPLSDRNIESAQANYTSGKLDFLRLLDAERQLYSQREMYYRAITEYHRRLAELDRAVGEPVR
jgi:outer membrane protein, heavy metal efflux system